MKKEKERTFFYFSRLRFNKVPTYKENMTFTITVVEHSIAHFVLILFKVALSVVLQRISGRPF